MKFRKKSVLALAVSVIMVLSISTACSKSGKTTTPQGKVHLTWLYFGSAAEQKQWTATAKAFTDSQTKIEVEYIPCSSDAYTQKLLTMFAANDAPDTFYARNAETPTLLKDNKLMDLAPLIKSDPSFKLDDYVNLNQINKPYMINGKVYAVTDNDNPMVLYYNKTLLTSLGMDDPNTLYQNDQWNWDAWTKIADKVRDSSKSSKPLYAFIQDAWFGPNFLWALSNGVDSFFTSDGKPAFNDPKVIEALNWDLARIKDKTILYGASAGKGMDENGLFATGQLAFVSAGRWDVPTFKTTCTSFKWDVVPFPKGPQATKYISYTPGYTAFAINADTKHPKEAWQWFSWFVGVKGQNQNWGSGGNCLPTIKGLENTVLSDTAYYAHPQVFLDIQKVSIWPDIDYAMNAGNTTLVDNAFQKVFMLQADPKQAMDQLDTDITNKAGS